MVLFGRAVPMAMSAFMIDRLFDSPCAIFHLLIELGVQDRSATKLFAISALQLIMNDVVGSDDRCDMVT